MYFGRVFEQTSIKNNDLLRRVLVDVLINSERYLTASPKAATHDPFENVRENRGVRHFNQVLKKS